MRAYYYYLVLFLGVLSAFGPFVIDMYLPALPEMSAYFNCDASMVQLGLTFCMVGLALGQLTFGPVSDRFGRKPVLVLSLVVYIMASAICCIATSIELFTASRFLQGIGGAGGIVLSRSIAADMYSGRSLARLIVILSAINNLAPIVAPVAGGSLVQFWSWQGVFIVLLALGVVLLVMGLVLKESLPAAHRQTGGAVATMRGYWLVWCVKGFPASSLTYGLSMSALFAYISSAPFIMQGVYGLGEFNFSLVFAVNAIALAIGSTWSLHFKDMRVAIHVGVIISVLMAIAGLVFAISGARGFLYFEFPVFVMLFGIGLVLTGATTQAMNLGREHAGAASALLGGIGYIAGGLVSPLVGLGNPSITAFACCGVLLAAALVLGRRS